MQAAATVSVLASHETCFMLPLRRSISHLGYWINVCMCTCLQWHWNLFFKEVSSQIWYEQTVIPIFTSTDISHTRFTLPHTRSSYRFVSPAAVFFTTSHLVSHTAITLSSKHPLQQLCMRFRCVSNTKSARFSILNYPAAGMPLLMKISCSH